MENVKVSEDGTHAIVSVNPKIYSLPTIYSAAYVFLDRAYLVLDENAGKVLVHIKPKDGKNPGKIGLEFHNELLNYANYSKNVKENNEITKMIVQRALLSADTSLAQDMEDKEIDELIKELEKEDDKDVKDVLKELKDEDKKK
jgi:His-Xaa-Ser system protein HxsD